MRKMKKTTLDWVEQIPAEWEIKKLKYCFAFGKGLSITKDNLEESGISVISYGQIHSKQNKGTAVHESLIRFVNESYLRTDISALVRKNDFIFADTSEDLEGCGNCVYNDYDGKLFAGYHTIIFRSQQPDAKYFAYLFLTDCWRSQIRKVASGVKLYSITQKILKETSIIIPPLAEQKKIADFLDEKCGEIVSIRSDVQREIEILNDYKKSVITEAVTKGINPKAKLKDSGIEWIGKIPEGWDVKKLKFYFNFGKGLPITKENLQDTGVPVISYGQIHSKQNSGTAINDTLIRFVNESYLRTNPSSLVHQNDFIFADTSEDLDGCGNCVYVDTKEPLFAGYHAIIFRSLQPNAKYFAYLFLTDCWRSQIRKVASGVKLYSITQKILKETSVIIPPLSEQKAIADYLDEKCSEIDATIADKQKQLETLDEYKKSLIFEYVTGKKEVS